MSPGSNRRRSFLAWYFRSNLLYRILAGLLLGMLAGLILGWISADDPAPTVADHYVASVQFFGDLFIRLLKMTVVPVVLFSLIGGAATIAPARLGRVGLKFLIYYLVTSAVAVAIGLALGSLVPAGWGFGSAAGAAVVVPPDPPPSLADVLLGIIPTNPLASLARGEILPVIVFSILFGVAVSLIKDSSNPKAARSAEILYEVCVAAADTMYTIIRGVMQYAPIGVFALISTVFATQGVRAVGTLCLIVLAVYVGLVVQLFACYGGFLAAYGLSLAAFIRKVWQPVRAAIATRSSSTTLPITLRVTEEKLGAPRSIASFSLPLGASINMDGTAVYLGVCAAFVGSAVGAPLGLHQHILVIVTATLACVGTAGVPGQGAIMLLMVLDAVGLPVESGTATAAAYAMILGVDAILDMGRTGLNVTGDMVGTVVVSKSEKVLDSSCWE